MRWLYRAVHIYNLGIAAVCAALFIATLVTGEGIVSFAFLVAAVSWAGFGIYWGRRSRTARRVAELAPNASGGSVSAKQATSDARPSSR